MDRRVPLAERKRQQARARIVRAAEDLFAERGFNAVSVADIADRAEVGRTTFFRYFGDKQEVVFAQEQEFVDTIATEQRRVSAPTPSSAVEAITQLEEIVVALCAQATQDPLAYTRHWAFVQQHPDLRARDALKIQRLASDLAEILTARGAEPDTARFASQIALACFQTAKSRAESNPRTLVAETRAVFEEALSLGRDTTS